MAIKQPDLVDTPKATNASVRPKARDIKQWGPSDETEITPAVINIILWDIKEGNADPVQSRRVLQDFLDNTESRRHSLSREAIVIL